MSNEAFEKWKSKCKCNLRTKLVGDGCLYCNTEEYIDNLSQEYDEILSENENLEREIAELKAQINGLRESIAEIAADAQDSYTNEALTKLLSKTPAQSLQEFENEVIERCAKVLEQMELIGGLDFAEAIRALIEKE